MRSERALGLALVLGAALLLAAAPTGATLPRSNGDVVFAHGFDWPTQEVGGANYHWHGLDPAECGHLARDAFGLLPTYHQAGVRAEAVTQLQQMHAHGMRTLVLGVFFRDGPATGTLVDAGDATQVAQMAANLGELLQDAAATGWERVFFRFFPQANMNPSAGSAFMPATLGLYENMITALRAPLAAGPLPYLIDLGVELAPRDTNPIGHCSIGTSRWDCPANKPWSNAVKDLWEFYLGAYGKADTVGFSFLPNYASMRSRVRHMRYVYGDHYPTILAVDPYGEQEHHEGEQFIEFVRAVDEFLAGSPREPESLIIAESWHNDPFAAARFSTAIAATRAPVKYFTAWPLDRGATCPGGGSPGVSVPPPLEFDMYRMFGF